MGKREDLQNRTTCVLFRRGQCQYHDSVEGKNSAGFLFLSMDCLSTYY